MRQSINNQPPAAGERPGNPAPRRRGFSLVEVLLAMFILGIGMIMVASVFPVGANWTRQATEESVAQTIVQNALSVIRTHYGPNGDLRAYLAPDFLMLDSSNHIVANFPDNKNIILRPGTGRFSTTPFWVQALPGFTNIPLNERAYQFGSSHPFPADWTKCTYFWTAVARLNPMHRDPRWTGGDTTNGVLMATSYNYDVYILVFRKGAIEQTFRAGDDVPGTRPNVTNFELIPSVCYGTWKPGAMSGSTWNPSNPPVPWIGQSGIGRDSGTVFRQVLNGGYNGAMPRPMILPNEITPTASDPKPIIYSPAPDNGGSTTPSASPLITIYQTTMSF
jgi:prepilin-type N-terminal cleavage/methylation domain-containing protein